MSDEWIPYPENEPEEDDEYLIAWTTKGSNRKKCFVEIQEWAGGAWQLDIPQAVGEVVVCAWMPLPAMYEV